MMKLIHAFYNMDANSVELTYNDGSVLTIDCEEVENHFDVTNGQMADLDWLLYNAPMEYASLVLSGEMENYLKGPALHGIEDQFQLVIGELIYPHRSLFSMGVCFSRFKNDSTTQTC